MREKLLSVERQTGVRPADLDSLVELPSSMIHLWNYFISLHNKRTNTGYGVNPIQFTEILAYCTLMNIQLFDWEVNLICKMDQVVLDMYAEQAEKEQNKMKAKSRRK